MRRAPLGRAAAGRQKRPPAHAQVCASVRGSTAEACTAPASTQAALLQPQPVKAPILPVCLRLRHTGLWWGHGQTARPAKDMRAQQFPAVSSASGMSREHHSQPLEPQTILNSLTNLFAASPAWFIRYLIPLSGRYRAPLFQRPHHGHP